ncbi:manganese lipoxygenase [Colletotrichum paranaense]|uniref:Manganese lipoxygenase n=1 Tax=Colletotrichum paranaense TaxID=1914294 RepID=A0ABQ9SXW7_9PEZI|nr:manganese lipoxygenase [Colletotrichum paranaense]KAK1544119.1 manganese lipoxygenase [Colletotrichum paranaense]
MRLYFTFSILVAIDSVSAVSSQSPSVTTALSPTTVSTQQAAPTKYTLPNEDNDLSSRAEEIKLKQQVITYGEPLIGDTSFFPNGSLGTQISLRDQSLWLKDSEHVARFAINESAAALEDITKHGGLKRLEDFKILYDGHWSGSVPGGIAKGQFSNFTSDLLFAMERLSTNPYIIRRLTYRKDKLPFPLDDKTVRKITGTTLDSLHRDGRLFLADHSYQKKYFAQQGRYSAACQALFYLDKRSDHILPLAIKTNVGADLTYTPLDTTNEWLLAKIMFNVNDFFHGQVYHLLNSHDVAEIVYLAALRTFSSRHPVLNLMERLMYQAYAIRPIGDRVLFNPGGFFDQNFAFSNVAVRQFGAEFYPTVAGPFQSNYFEDNLRLRGLLHSPSGPKLPHFPFYEDGKEIVGVIRKFIEAFVEATYKSDRVLSKDWELQAWITESNGPAEVIDFPSAPLRSRKQLVDILSHMAWLTGVSRHVLNQGEPVTASGVLPLHPLSLYAPLPTKKGRIENLLPWLPNEQKSVDQITLLARFNRPQVVEKNQTLRYMFNAESLLAGTNRAVAVANDRFMKDIGSISRRISGRRFDSEGLSQGMPFIWTGMDPGVIPFYLSV